MRKRQLALLLCLVMALSLLPLPAMAVTTNEKKIYLSPSDQTANSYAYGETTEAIECRRIADALEIALKRNGFQVKNNQTGSMEERVEESDAWGADLHVPLHTNAFNGEVGGTRIFTYDTSGKGWQCAKKVYNYLAPLTPGTSDNMTADASLYEIRVPAAPTVYIESEFHDVPEIAKWIIENTDNIAEAICQGICSYFNVTYIAPALLDAPIITMSNNAPTGYVYIEWPAVEGATEYEIWCAASADGAYTKMCTTTATAYTDTNGTVGATYYYKVRALDVEGNPGAFSAAESCCVDCAEPVITATADNDHQRINLEWADVTGATMYNIYRARGDSATYEMIASTTDVRYYDNDVTPDVLYSYKLIAQCDVDEGESAYSNVDSAIVTMPFVPEKSEQIITADDVNATCGDTDISIVALTDGDGTLTYEVIDGVDVVSVDSDGRLTILKAGTATIRITASATDDYNMVTRDVTVTVAPDQQHTAVGDVNGDGAVNQKDVARLRQYIADGVNYPLNVPQIADVNNDGAVNQKDVARLRQYIADPETYPLG